MAFRASFYVSYALSHETPLATITGASNSLMESAGQLDDTTRLLGRHDVKIAL